MAINIQIRRDTAANWAANDPTPAGGEFCWATDTAQMKIGNGVDPYSVLPYWPSGSGGSISRLEYGNIQLTIAEATPLSNIAFIGAGERMAADIKKNYVQYSNCLWDIQELSPGTGSWEGLRFPTAADLYTFLAANAEAWSVDPTRYANTIVGKVYDNIDSSNPKIHKIYGQNTFLASLRGRKQYKRSTSVVIEGNCNWTSLTSWFADLCNQGIGLPSGELWATDRERVVWLPQNNNKTSGLPKDGFWIGHSGSSTERWCWDEGTGTFHIIPLSSSWVHSPGQGIDKTFCLREINSPNSWSWSDNDWGNALRYTTTPTSTTLCLYHMINQTNPQQHAVFAKPVGVDNLGFNWFDNTSYSLYAVYFTSNATPIIRKIWVFGNQDELADLIWVAKEFWCDPRFGTTKISYSMTGLGLRDVRFMLRNDSTLDVSEVSIPYVHPARKHRNAPLKLEVRR